jgi:predicted neuraminidase
MKIIHTLFAMLLISGQSGIDGQDAHPPGIILTEFIYRADDVPFPSCHASTIEETEDGLIAAWFGGTREKDPDVGIWISRFSSGKWTVPVEVANGIQPNHKRYPTWNPVLFNTGSGLNLFYKVGASPREWWGEVIRSADNGKSWSPPEKLPEGIFGPIKNKPLAIGGGILVSGSSTENKGWRVHMEISPDMGITWTRTAALNDGRKVAVIQPTVLQHRDGRLQILCRSRNNVIFTAWSSDKGETWSEFENVGLPNPNAGFDAVTLLDGRHLLVYNHIACEPGKGWGDRNILNLAVSADGIHWKAAALLENDPDPDAEYSYPAIIQAGDGKVHITYTWNRELIKHVVIDPSQLEGTDIIDGAWPSD